MDLRDRKGRNMPEADWADIKRLLAEAYSANERGRALRIASASVRLRDLCGGAGKVSGVYFSAGISTSTSSKYDFARAFGRLSHDMEKKRNRRPLNARLACRVGSVRMLRATKGGHIMHRAAFAIFGLFWGLASSMPLAIAQQDPTAEQCERAWASVLENEGPAALELFIEELAKCPQADQARQDLIAFTEPQDAGDDNSSDRAAEAGGFNIPESQMVFTPAGRLLLTGMPMRAQGGGYGVILLRRNRPQNLVACQVFVNSLGFTPGSVDAVEIVDGAYVYRRPVYWLTRAPVSGTSVTDCPSMLANYDYDRASIMIARLQAGGHTGPFMAIWRADGSAAGLFDYSDLPSAELAAQFDRSLFHIAQSGQIWESRFYERASFEAHLAGLLRNVTRPSQFLAARLVSFQLPTVRLSQ